MAAAEAPVAPAVRCSLRVLGAIDLGGNWGHLLRMKPVLERLSERGHACTLATSSPATALSLFGDSHVRVLGCPSARYVRMAPPPANFKGYVQVLESIAFGDDAVLASNIRLWKALLRQARPDAMLTDFAPMALFMAHLCGIPVVQLPTGWEAPRGGEPLPSIYPWEAEDRAPLDAQEARLLARLNRHCASHGVAQFEHLADLYSVGSQLLCTWPETDHFAPRANAAYVGPIFSRSHGQPARWHSDTGDAGPRIFVYLVADRRNAALLEALCALEADVIAVLPGVPGALARRLREAGMQVFDGPVQLDGLYAAARLVVSNGGHGLTAATLAVGVPLLLLPRNAEQVMLSRRLAEQGLARMISGQEPIVELERALADESLHGAARAMSRRYAGMTVDAALAAVCGEVERVAEAAFVQT